MSNSAPLAKRERKRWTKSSAHLTMAEKAEYIELSEETERMIPTPCSNCTGYPLGFPFKVEGPQGWAGNQPCVYGPTEGCSRHNPHKLPIAYNKRIPSDKKKTGFFERFLGRSDTVDYDEIQRSDRIWTMIHLDRSTADPLDPVHPSIRYALAFYHLDWIRNAKSPETRSGRAHSLACSGTASGEGTRRPDLEFWINPYWHAGSVLLQQVVRFIIEPKKQSPLLGREIVVLQWPWSDWTFQTCPHYRHRFQMCEFQRTRGLMKADMSYGTKYMNPLGRWTRSRTHWRSVYGPSHRVFNCQQCCTDSLLHINLVEDKIVVHLYAWKDLGKAKDPFDGRWIAALRPSGPSWRRSRVDINKHPVRSAVQAAKNEAKKNRAGKA